MIVRAAGGVVVRSRDGRREVAVVHRPKYDDWSLPKGKLDEGEDWPDAALREVEEETGLRCALGEELEPGRYPDRKGTEKLVRWWAMTPIEGAFAPNHEVDDLRWIELERAHEVLDYPHDRELVRSLTAAPASNERPGP